MAPDKYRNIGAQAEADSGKLIGAQVELPEIVQAQQSGCSIGAAAAEAAAHGQPFGDADGDRGQVALSPLKECSGRSNDEVVLVVDTGNRLREPHPRLAGCQGEAQFVAVVQKLEQCLKLVIAIIPAPDNVQEQVQLGR